MQGEKATELARPAGSDEDLFDRLVHDLRNPLGVIAYFAEAVPGAAAAERDGLCERLRINAQRVLYVLDEFALLANLRAGRSTVIPEAFDVAELVEEVGATLESLERRPGGIGRRVDVRAPLRIPRTHVACALRALLREALRATPPADALDLSVREEVGQVLFRLTAPLRVDSEFGVAARLPTSGIEIELAERVAALHGGRCTIEQRPGRRVITLALAAH